MSSPAPAPTFPEVPPRPAGVRFPQTPLDQALLALGLAALTLLAWGYCAMRFDHVVQLPYLLMEREPGLFARDWYLQSDPHDKIRYFHLLLIRGASAAIGLDGALLALLVGSLAVTYGAWFAISRRLFGSPTPAVLAALMAIWFRGQELGANALVENIFIPRVEANALAWVALAVLLARRPAASGLLFAVAGLFQPAVPLQFAGVLALWILIAWERPRLRPFLAFSLAYWVVSLPWMLYLSGTVTGESSLTPEEIIRIFAYIRHPAHMIPFSWGLLWASSGLLLVLFFEAWTRRADGPEAAGFGRLVPLIAGLLAVAVVFIEIVPVKWMVLFQPFRATMLLYFAVFMVLGREVEDGFRAPGFARPFRAALLIVSLDDLVFFAPVALAELTLNIAARSGRPLGEQLQLLLGLGIAAAVVAFHPDQAGNLLVAAAGAGLVFSLRRRSEWMAPRRVRMTLAAAITILACAPIAFRAMPWDRWVDGGEGERYNLAERTLMRYQFVPVAVPALERMGVWARENTPRHALFVVPPERRLWAFRLFAQRAQVFDVKSIPYYPAGMEEWRNRYLAHRGVLDPADPASAEARERAMNDLDSRGIADDYAALTADQMVMLARRYSADYAITPTRYADPRLQPVHSEAAPEYSGRGRALHAYRVVPEVAPAPA